MRKFLRGISIAGILILSGIQSLYSQDGSIRGVVVDPTTGETLVGAAVVIEGTFTGSTTDFDGIFELGGLAAGHYNLQVSFISYKPLLLEGVEVRSGETTTLDIELLSDTQVLEGIVVQARVLRNRENILLLDRQNAVEMVQSIGAQELSRKGVGDVASAVTKISGISRQEGSSRVFIRGLGDRYNATTLNGLPIPSNNPEEKNISLDLFSTDLVEYIAVDKVYNNEIYGDFAGGNVNIASKDFAGDPFLQLSVGGGANEQALGASSFQLKSGPGFWGYDRSTPATSLSRFSFPHDYTTTTQTPLNQSWTLSGGQAWQLSGSKELNVFATAGFDNDYGYKEGITLNVNNSGYASKDLRTQNYSYSTNATGMLNLGFKWNDRHRMHYNLVYVNSSNNSNENYYGTILDIADYDNGLLLRRSFEQNTVLINQLLGQHTLGASSELNWGLSYNGVSSRLPDRIQNTFRQLDNGAYVFGQNQITDNHRYRQRLDEDELAFNAAFSHRVGDPAGQQPLRFTLGYSGRFKQRDFEATQFNFRIHTDQRNTEIDPERLSAFFNQELLDRGNYFRIETFRGSAEVPNALRPQVYGGEQLVHAGWLTTEYRPGSKFTLVLGLRGEMLQQTVSWNTQLDPSDRKDLLEDFALLPSLNGRYVLNEQQNIRFGLSKTHTLPQFKERALFIYEDVTQVKLGNPDLYQSDNYNLDLGWDWYPASGELIALGLFGKYINNPINEVTISSATNDISFLNTGDWGYVGGFEVEVRKLLWEGLRSRVQSGLNASYMLTNQELSSEKVSTETPYRVQFTHDEARFTGASDWLLNADLSYQYRWNEDENILMATLGYQYFSEKVYALGTNDRGNMINKPFGLLDLVVRLEKGRFSTAFSAKNLLNPAVETYQANSNQDVLIESYRRGLDLGLSLTYRF